MVAFLRMFHGPALLRAASRQRCGIGFGVFLPCGCIPQHLWLINSSGVSLHLPNTDGDR